MRSSTDFRHASKASLTATAMFLSVIAMAICAVGTADATFRTAPAVAPLDEVRRPAGGWAWMEIPDVELFDDIVLVEEHGSITARACGGERGWYYAALVPAGDPLAADARAHLRDAGIDDAAGRRLAAALFARAPVLVRMRNRTPGEAPYELRNGASRARGILHEAPSSLESMRSGRREGGGPLVLFLEQEPLRSTSLLVGFGVAWAVFLLVLRTARRTHVLGPAKEELYQAVGDQDFEPVILLLVFLGAAIDRRDARGRTTLHAAVVAGHRRVIRRLVARGIDIEARDGRGETALHQAAASQRDVLIVKLLLELGADPTAMDAAGRTPAELERVHHSFNAASDEERRRRVQELLAAAAADREAGLTSREGSGSPPGPPPSRPRLRTPRW